MDDITPSQANNQPERPQSTVDPVSAQPLTNPAPSSIDRNDHVMSKKRSKPPRKDRGGWHDFFSTAGILVTALVVALLMIAFVFRSYQVDGPSMQNTLQNNDKLIIWKVPRTWADITRHAYIPQRGNIIVFNQTNLSACGQSDSKQLIKRVIGLPGDRVVVSNGVYTIYNNQHPEGFDPDKTLTYFKGVPLPTTSGNINVTLGANQLFVSGDNRPDSCDSRAFGPITADQVIGKLAVRVYPINTSKIF